MFCMSCGSKLSDNARFCMSCGSPVKPAVTENVEEIKEEVVQSASEAVEAIKEEATESVTSESDAVKDAVYNAESDFDNAVEAAKDNFESVVVEKTVSDLESTVDTSLDADVVEALETPDIPKSELEVEKINVTPVIPPVAEPETSTAANVETIAVADETSSTVNKPVEPVNNAAPQVNNVQSHIPSDPVKKEHEAFKPIALIGAIISIVACFLELHSFNDCPDGTYIARVDKLYEFTEGIIIVVAMSFAVLFLLMRLSAFALSGVIASIVAYGIFIRRFYLDDMEVLKVKEAAFQLGIGSFVLVIGLFLALVGLFLKFSKRKLFKI